MKIIFSLLLTLLGFSVYSQNISIGSSISLNRFDDTHTYKGVYGSSLSIFVEKKILKNISLRPDVYISYLSDKNIYDKLNFHDKRVLTGINLNFQYNFPYYNPYKITTYHLISGVGFINYNGKSNMYDTNANFNKINKEVNNIIINFGFMFKTKLNYRMSLINMISYSMSDDLYKNLNNKKYLFNYLNRNDYISNINFNIGIVYDLYKINCFKY